MANFEFATGFECSLTYDKNLFVNKTPDEIVDALYSEYKIPDYSVYGSSNYSSTYYIDMFMIKHNSSSHASIPFIYFKTSGENNILDYLGIVGGTTSGEYSCVYNETNSSVSYYNWYDGSTRTRTISSGESLSNYSQISDNNYRAGDFWTGENGYPFHVNTNLPLFHVIDGFDYTNVNVQSFMRGEISAESLLGLYDKIIAIVNNAETEEEPDGEEFEISNIGTSGNFTEYGASIGTERYYRFVRGKVLNGKLALYKIDGVDNGVLKYGISLIGSLYGCQYSTDGGVVWHDTDTFPFDFLYRERKKELGSFDFALTNSVTRTPIFKNKSDADDYQDGTKDETDADNWEDISLYHPEKVTSTGRPDTATTFGEVYTKAHFSQQYICSSAVIQDISNGLFDISSGGFFEKIKKGVEMYGANPIDCVQSLVFYPMDLTTVFTSTLSQNYIYFGGYKYDLSVGNVNKIVFPNGFKDLGEFDIKSRFGTKEKPHYMDFEPYTKLRVFLPYIGWRELDIKRYINKKVKVRYYIDTRTNGTCTACLIANGVLVDYFNGQMGVSMPITLTDFTSYANTQIRTLLGGGSDITSSGVDMVSSVANSSPVGVGVGVTKGMANVGKTTYNLNLNNVNNFNATKGGSTSMINQYLPQEVCFELEVQQIDKTSNAPELRGYPSNTSGRLYNFNGYLEVNEVQLVCEGATDSEKEEIISLLHSGIHINN